MNVKEGMYDECRNESKEDVEGRNDYLPRNEGRNNYLPSTEWMLKEGMITYLVLNECKGRIVKEGMNNEWL